MIKSRVIGIMSGTSMDGLDIAQCLFKRIKNKWSYQIEKAITIDYDDYWRNKLNHAGQLNGFELISLDREFGNFIGECIKTFIKDNNTKIDSISSHGHTIFHQPEKGITYQIGDGAAIAAVTGITTVSDFRNLNVAFSGQGAPLVPVGDDLLYPDFDTCLNLGGFANISYNKAGSRIAYDVCPVNIVLNTLAQLSGRKFDRDGYLGKQGIVDDELLEKLNSILYYKKDPPKSLGKEWVESDFLPLIHQKSLSNNAKLRTIYQHIIIELKKSINGIHAKNILTTGGGAFNKFLMRLLKENVQGKIVVPSVLEVKYKESLIFAFLGLLRINEEINCYSSATGSEKDLSVGIINIV